ncbi:MAG: type I restriction-modification system subunit M N-terminal domain-containing protein [Polyangiaceae bacterium]
MAKSKTAQAKPNGAPLKDNSTEPKKRGRPKKGAGAPTGTAKDASAKTSGANLGFEQTLWQAADKLRNNLDAAEYKHVVLGLIFLKYISDAFEEKHAALTAEMDSGADPEDRDEYLAENIFWVPKAARWPALQGKARSSPRSASWWTTRCARWRRTTSR